MYEFTTAQPLTLAAKLASGLLEVSAEERGSATVEVRPWDEGAGAREAAEQVRVELDGDRLVIEAEPAGMRWLLGRGSRVRVTVRVPLDTALDVRVSSADVRCAGRYGASAVHSASGDVVLDEVAGDLSAALTSGDLRVDRVAGDFDGQAASGDLFVGPVGGEVTATTASGDVRLGECAGSVAVRTASGDITVDSVQSGEAKIHSASGDVRIGVRPGTGVWLDLTSVSGATRSELAVADAPAAEPTGDTVTLRVRTASGDILVRRALPTPAR